MTILEDRHQATHDITWLHQCALLFIKLPSSSSNSDSHILSTQSMFRSLAPQLAQGRNTWCRLTAAIVMSITFLFLATGQARPAFNPCSLVITCSNPAMASSHANSVKGVHELPFQHCASAFHLHFCRSVVACMGALQYHKLQIHSPCSRKRTECLALRKFSRCISPSRIIP